MIQQTENKYTSLHGVVPSRILELSYLYFDLYIIVPENINIMDI